MASHHLIELNIIVVRKRNVTYNLFGATAATTVERHSHAYLHILVPEKQERTVRCIPFVIVAFLLVFFNNKINRN